MDCNYIDQLKSGYDGMIASFCMPYLSKKECEKLVQNAAGLLHQGGIFYTSFIEGDNAKSGWQTSSNGLHKMFVYYHQLDYLAQSLALCMFNVLKVGRKKYPKINGNFETHLILIAGKE